MLTYFDQSNRNRRLFPLVMYEIFTPQRDLAISAKRKIENKYLRIFLYKQYAMQYGYCKVRVSGGLIVSNRTSEDGV